MPEGVPTKDAWASPAHDARGEVDLGFVARTWAVAESVTIAIAGVVSIAVALMGSFERAVEVLTWGLTISAFVTFLIVLRSRLPHVAAGRLVNSLLVAACHLVASAAALLLLLAVAQAVPRVDVVEGLFVLASTAILVVLASIIAPAVIPERGPVPRGTQHEQWDELNRL